MRSVRNFARFLRILVRGPGGSPKPATGDPLAKAARDAGIVNRSNEDNQLGSNSVRNYNQSFE